MQKILESAVGWIRWYQKEIIASAIIFMVASLSFGFGYLANRQFNHAPIIIEKCSEAK